MAIVYTILILIMTIIMMVLAVMWHHRNCRFGFPHPPSWPLIGCQLDIHRNRHRLLDWTTAFFTPYHRTIRISSLTRTTFFTVHPPNVEHILKTNFQNYPKGEEFHQRQSDLLGEGIFNVDGHMWRMQRKFIRQQFSTRRLREENYVIYRRNALKLLEILNLYQKQDIDIQGLFFVMTFQSSLQLLSGEDVNMSHLNKSLITAFDISQETTFKRYLSPWWRIKKRLCIGCEGRFKRNLEILNNFLAMQVAKIKKRHQYTINGVTILKEPIGVLSYFNTHLFNNTGMATPSSHEKGLRDIVMNLLVASRDTIACSLTWFIYCMCVYQDKQEKVFEEILSIGQKHNFDIEKSHSKEDYLFQMYTDMLAYEVVHNGMPYLHAALTETLRLYPPVPWDGKEALEDDILPDGTEIKAGNQVAYFPYAMGRMSFLWGDDALEFKPERWLTNNGEFREISPFKFTAFQAGPRMCIGKDTSYLQMKITCAMLLCSYHFKIVTTHPIVKKIMFVMSMKHGLKVTATPRWHHQN